MSRFKPVAIGGGTKPATPAPAAAASKSGGGKSAAANKSGKLNRNQNQNQKTNANANAKSKSKSKAVRMRDDSGSGDDSDGDQFDADGVGLDDGDRKLRKAVGATRSADMPSSDDSDLDGMCYVLCVMCMSACTARRTPLTTATPGPI